MRQWIVEHEGGAFAYVQVYPANAWPQTHFTHLPKEAVVIDTYTWQFVIARGASLS
jgi:hypothetical protein